MARSKGSRTPADFVGSYERVIGLREVISMSEVRVHAYGLTFLILTRSYPGYSRFLRLARWFRPEKSLCRISWDTPCTDGPLACR